MATKPWWEAVIGAPAPPALQGIDWQEVSDGGQRYGEDPFGNDWRCERSEEGYSFWTTLASDYRADVYLPVFLRTDGELVVTDVEIEAYVSFGPCHGRPGYLSPQSRECMQAIRLLKQLAKVK